MTYIRDIQLSKDQNMNYNWCQNLCSNTNKNDTNYQINCSDTTIEKKFCFINASVSPLKALLLF